MTRLCELPRLNKALDLMGLDIGANAVADVVIPASWNVVCLMAEDELRVLSDPELVMLTQGCEDEQDSIGLKVPRAKMVLDAAFDDGDLADVVFKPWSNIFDAREAEQRVNGKK